MDAADGPIDVGYFFAMLDDIKVVGAAFSTEVADGCAEGSDFAPATLVQDPRQTLLEPIHHQAPLTWHSSHQVMELFFDGFQVFKNVGVIELKVVQDGRARSVMNKLAALVKKRGVVFIGFNYKVVSSVAWHDFAQTR